MSDANQAPVAPPWTWKLTALAALLATAAAVVDGPWAGSVTATLVGIAGVGVVYLLYAWGQHREREDGGADDGRGQRRKEMEAEAGGYGGNGGGV
jgi:hypothetical protein